MALGIGPAAEAAGDVGEMAVRSGGGLGTHSEDAAEFHSTAAGLPMHSPTPTRTNSIGSDAETLVDPERAPSPLTDEEMAATEHLPVPDSRSVSPFPSEDSLKGPVAGVADQPTHMPAASRMNSFDSRADTLAGVEPAVARKPVAGGGETSLKGKGTSPEVAGFMKSVTRKPVADSGEKSLPAESTSPQVTHLINELATHPSLTPRQADDFMNRLAAHPSAGTEEKPLPSAAASAKAERQSVASIIQKVGQAIRNNPIKTSVALGSVGIGTGVGVAAGNESPSE